MRLLFGRPVRAEGRQPEHLTAPAVHLPTLLVSQRDQLDGDHTRVPPGPVSCRSSASASQFLATGGSLGREGPKQAGPARRSYEVFKSLAERKVRYATR